MNVYRHPVPSDGDCLYTAIGLSLKMPGDENLYRIFHHLAYYHADHLAMRDKLYDVELFSARHLRIFVAVAAIQDTSIAINYRTHLTEMYTLSLTDPSINQDYPFLGYCIDPITQAVDKDRLYRTMLQSIYWGGEFALRTLQHYFNIQVVIVNANNKTLVDPPSNALVSLLLAYNGNHYDPIVYDCPENKTAIVANDKVDYILSMLK